MSKNDITGDELRSRIVSDAYREHYERIFGFKEKLVKQTKEYLKTDCTEHDAKQDSVEQMS